MEFLAAFAVCAIALLGCAIGVMFGRDPLKGSCGGVGTDCQCTKAATGTCRRRSNAHQ